MITFRRILRRVLYALQNNTIFNNECFYIFITIPLDDNKMITK